MPSMPSPITSTLVALLGIPVMAIGLAGWILPVIPGAPLFFIGLAMTIGWHPKGRALVQKMQQGLKRLAQRCGLWSKSSGDINTELFKPPQSTESTKDNVRADQG